MPCFARCWYKAKPQRSEVDKTRVELVFHLCKRRVFPLSLLARIAGIYNDSRLSLGDGVEPCLYPKVLHTGFEPVFRSLRGW